MPDVAAEERALLTPVLVSDDGSQHRLSVGVTRSVTTLAPRSLIPPGHYTLEGLPRSVWARASMPTFEVLDTRDDTPPSWKEEPSLLHARVLLFRGASVATQLVWHAVPAERSVSYVVALQHTGPPSDHSGGQKARTMVFINPEPGYIELNDICKLRFCCGLDKHIASSSRYRMTVTLVDAAGNETTAEPLLFRTPDAMTTLLAPWSKRFWNSAVYDRPLVAAFVFIGLVTFAGLRIRMRRRKRKSATGDSRIRWSRITWP